MGIHVCLLSCVPHTSTVLSKHLVGVELMFCLGTAAVLAQGGGRGGFWVWVHVPLPPPPLVISLHFPPRVEGITHLGQGKADGFQPRGKRWRANQAVVRTTTQCLHRTCDDMDLRREAHANFKCTPIHIR